MFHPRFFLGRLCLQLFTHGFGDELTQRPSLPGGLGFCLPQQSNRQINSGLYSSIYCYTATLLILPFVCFLRPGSSDRGAE